MERFFSLAGIFVLLGLACLCSSDRRRIPWRIVIVGIGLQLYLALFIVRTEWVPWLLPAAAGACIAILLLGLVRELPGFWTPTAAGLGLLGALTTILHLALSQDRWSILLASVPVLWAWRRFTRGVGLAGCAAIVAALFFWDLPEDFVFCAVDGVGRGVKWLVDFALVGADYVFGGLRGAGGFVFALEVGAIILFFGATMSVLYHVGVIPWLVGMLARMLRRALGVSGAESLAAASNVFVGQTEAPLIVRPYLARMTRSEVMALMTGGFATIAGSVFGAYVAILGRAGFERGAADLIAASVMSAPAAFVFAKLFVPETEEPETRGDVELKHEPIGENALDALAGGVTAALKLAVNVVAMLLVFYALIKILDTSVNWVSTELLDRSIVDEKGEPAAFRWLYARAFAPFAFLMGVPWSDCVPVGELLGTKTIFNEFIAYERLGGMITDGALATRSAVLSTYALCGFANFMSVGIQIAGLSQLAPGKRTVFSQLALRAMVAGVLACQLTACIVGVIGKF